MFDRKHVERGRMSAHDSRQYLAWANSYSRMLSALGLQPQAVVAKPATLQDYVSSRTTGGSDL